MSQLSLTKQGKWASWPWQIFSDRIVVNMNYGGVIKLNSRYRVNVNIVNEKYTV